MSTNNFTVYKHTAPNGKVYIGITEQKTERRWRKDGSGYKQNNHFWHSICKYGWDNFQHEIIASGLSKDEACLMEVELIAKCDSMNPEKGFNCHEGGEHPPFTAETRKKISDLAKSRNQVGENNPNYGNHKLAGKNNPNYGNRHSKEMRAIISERRKGKGRGPKSEETKRLMREHHAGGTKPKKVICVEKGEIFESINDAARKIGVPKGRISGCCRELPHFNSAGGYHWQYHPKED